jgi:hypothetical protein
MFFLGVHQPHNAGKMALIVVTKTVNVSSWNDNPGRTHAEVIAVYDAAIAATEVGGPAV